MLDVLFKETVTLRRAAEGTRTAAGGPTYATVRTEATLPLRIKCRIERGVSRSYGLQVTEADADAFMTCRRPTAGDFRETDLVVDSEGTVYKVMRLEAIEPLFGSARYLKATLKESRLPVEANE